MNKAVISIAILSAGVSGCASTITSGGVLPIGPDMYMLSIQGGTLDHSGNALKAKLYPVAAKFCADKDRVMVPMNSTSQDAGLNYSNAEVQFRCLLKDDPRTK
jgi:hypothetical protein